MKHSEQCLKEQSEAKRLHDAWVAKWPNYCHKCGGAGEVTWQENQSPIGSGMVWLETLSEPCENCVLNDKCPRCGDKISWDDVLDLPQNCKHCGFDFDNPEPCPPAGLEYPCECELSAEPEDMPY